MKADVYGDLTKIQRKSACETVIQGQNDRSIGQRALE
jgi:hypothetical protein